MRVRTSGWVAALLCLSACTVFTPGDSGRVAMFDQLWNDFDAHYGLFAVKPDVDWDVQYETYRPLVSEDLSDEEFGDVLRDVMAPLDDGHVFLLDWVNDPWVSYVPPRDEPAVSGEVIRSLLTDVVESDDGMYVWGRWSQDVGYLRLNYFDDSRPSRTLNRVFDDFEDAGRLVVDIRATPGGNDATSIALAACFASETTPFLNVRLRNGPNRDDFSDVESFSIEPDPNCHWTGRTVLLTDAFTVSAGEVFTLAMNDLPGVTHVGEHTVGAFSDVVSRELPNGWLYGMSIGDWRDENDISYEGLGVPPEIEVVNTPVALEEGRDLALELAVEVVLEP